MIKIQENRDALVSLGNGLELSTNNLKDLETLYLNILGKKDALHLHALRASAQTYVWKQALNPQYKTLDFTQFGYKKENDTLLPLFINKSSFPTDLKKPCNCKKACKTKACYYRKNNISCILLCGCDSED
ncbi:hypothetical protein PV326_002039, partial [Microctonus aethiopoides]